MNATHPSKSAGPLLMRLLACLVLVIVSTTTVALGSADQARATPAACDGNAVVGVFQRVGSGASFSFNGRSVELQNEKHL